ncbi:hypothetical protein [Crocosphaera chwakensis]|uniref:hypothetical protein n=1 Tax=Crocosphaera chwakensis TaxID=2546361 RepID=UPI0012F9352E|nr:hypothetical protein [Crocosphaera chwakensis]
MLVRLRLQCFEIRHIIVPEAIAISSTDELIFKTSHAIATFYNETNDIHSLYYCSKI